ALDTRSAQERLGLGMMPVAPGIGTTVEIDADGARGVGAGHAQAQLALFRCQQQTRFRPACPGDFVAHARAPLKYRTYSRIPSATRQRMKGLKPMRAIRRRNRCRQAKVTTADPTMADSGAPHSEQLPPSSISNPLNSPLAMMMGMASRKENLAAARRSRPQNRPAVMVTPERDVPGIRAITWATPMINAPFNVSDSNGRCAGA